MWKALIFCCLIYQTGRTSGTGTNNKRGVPIPKTEHERFVLRAVADRIYDLLGSSKISRRLAEHGPAEESGDMLSSVLSMVVEGEGQAPQVESEARVLETLSNFIVEESERIRKRNGITKITSRASNPKLQHHDKFPFELTTAAVPTIPADSPGGSSFKAIDAISNFFKKNTADVHEGSGQQLTRLNSEENEMAKVVPKSVLSSSSFLTNQSSDELDPARPVLKLTPHILFTDAEGREYRLIGVGGGGGSQQSSCSHQCLTTDAASRDVLAFDSPSPGEFLVLADSGGEKLFTSGVQLCEDAEESKKTDRQLRSPDLAMFVAQKKRDSGGQSKMDVKWKEVKKREEKVDHGEFKEHADKFFKGPGMSAKVNKKEIVSPQKVLSSLKSPDKGAKKVRRRHASLRRRKSAKNKRQAREAKEHHKGNNAHVRAVENNEPHAENPLQTKLLESLEKNKHDLLEFSKGGKAKIDVDRCKRRCDSIGAQIERLTDFDDDIDMQRSKRSSDFDLMPHDKYSSSQNGGNATLGKEYLSLQPFQLKGDENDFKIVPVEPEKPLTNAEEQNVQSGESVGDEEINMIQPTTSSEVEDEILLLTTTKQSYTDSQEVWSSSPEQVENGDAEVERDYDVDVADDEGENEVASMKPEWVAEEDKTTFSPDVYDSVSLVPTEHLGKFQDVHETPVSAELAARLDEEIKKQVEKEPILKNFVAPALKFTDHDDLTKASIPPPKYSSAMNVLLKTFMINVEKVAEQEAAERNCIQLDSELQEFLAQILGLPSNQGPAARYQQNVNQFSYEDLALRKNQLVELLREFRQLTPNEQRETSGVQNFIEGELHSLENEAESAGTADHYRNSRQIEISPFSQTFASYKSRAEKWIDPFNVDVAQQVKPFLAKPFVNVRPYPERDEHPTGKIKMEIGMHVKTLPTPAFLVSLPKLKNNCQKMLKKFEDLNIRLRPHVKTHKTLEGALIQTGGRKSGIVVSTVAEAEFYVEKGFDDIVVGRPVTRNLVERCQSMLKKATLHFLVTSEEGVSALTSVGRPVSALLKISAGYERAGIPWDDETTIIKLAKGLHDASSVSFQGIYVHCGDSYTTDYRQVKKVRDDSVDRILRLRDVLDEEGIKCIQLGIGSTPSCSLSTTPLMAQLTEVHTGNYAFYDCQQESYGACKREDIVGRVMTRVVTHQSSRNQIVVDLGFTGLTKQGLDLAVPGYAAIEGYPNLKLMAMSQELGKITTVDGSAINFQEFPIDSPLFLLPYHACATAGMYPFYYVHDDQGIVCDIWRPVRGW